MSTLCTFPGRAGDILWALPTVRAISEALGEPVDFGCCGEFEGLAPLLSKQSYIAVVRTTDRWSLTPPNEWQPPADVWDHATYDRILHLGYRGWPQVPLARQTYSTAHQHYSHLVTIAPLDLQRPWITVDQPFPRTGVAVGFTEEWFELKVGLMGLLTRSIGPMTPVMIPNGRWEKEWSYTSIGCEWSEAAYRIAQSKVFVGCCSAPHVLAVALGVPVVLVEPSEARQNPVFYPVGMDGPQVTIVRGMDGNPTYDARAVALKLEEALR